MFRSAFLTLTMASSLSYGATEAFNSLNSAAQSVTGVYAAAGDLLNVDYGISSTAQARMYAAAEKLRPLADRLDSGALDPARRAD